MSLPCKECVHCTPSPEGRRCRKFVVRGQPVETAIARYDGYDLCGKKGVHFERIDDEKKQLTLTSDTSWLIDFTFFAHKAHDHDGEHGG